MKLLIQCVLLLGMCAGTMFAQEEAKAEKPYSFSSGLDFVSSYNWRGQDLGKSPAIQPYAAVSAYGFEFGTWGSYAFNSEALNDAGVKVPFTEIDLNLKYKLTTHSGTFAIEAVDFFYPYMGKPYSHYNLNEDPAHMVNVALHYTGKECCPVSLLVDYSAINDPDKSIYIEAAYPVKFGETEVGLVCGVAKGKDKSVLYDVDGSKLAFVNTGFTVTKNITFSKEFSMPIATSFIFNPYRSAAFLVVKASL
ncbi:MAG: hypothetical protein LWX56_06150 [Ignavibacteria bacterium]|nr:hypothetical protein [Ignavibacteria bacterium]